MSQIPESNFLPLRAMILGYQAKKVPCPEAYTDYLSTAGEDVMSYEEFGYWFQSFERGFFDQSYEWKSGPEMSKNFLKSNPISLRTCVLYHLKENKPIFETYKIFSETVGIEAMDFPEFEFWFRRFEQGLLDLTYDRRLDPQHPELLDLPLDVLETIVQTLNLNDVHSLLQVCSKLKQIAKDTDIPFQNACLSLTDCSLNLTVNGETLVSKEDHCEMPFPDPFGPPHMMSADNFVKVIGNVESLLDYPKVRFKKFEVSISFSHICRFLSPVSWNKIIKMFEKIGYLVTTIYLRRISNDRTSEMFPAGKIDGTPIWIFSEGNASNGSMEASKDSK